MGQLRISCISGAGQLQAKPGGDKVSSALHADLADGAPAKAALPGARAPRPPRLLAHLHRPRHQCGSARLCARLACCAAADRATGAHLRPQPGRRRSHARRIRHRARRVRQGARGQRHVLHVWLPARGQPRVRGRVRDRRTQHVARHQQAGRGCARDEDWPMVRQNLLAEHCARQQDSIANMSSVVLPCSPVNTEDGMLAATEHQWHLRLATLIHKRMLCLVAGALACSATPDQQRCKEHASGRAGTSAPATASSCWMAAT